MTRKIAFFVWWSWFKFNNFGLALDANLKFSASLLKGLKLKVRKFWGLIPTFVEVKGEKLVGGTFLPPPILYRVNNEIGFICKIFLYSRTENIVSKEKCRWDKIHNKKLDKLHSERRYISKPKYRIVKNIINNFSWYTLTLVEEYVLFSLDQHIPTKNNTKNIKTEFERFSITYRNIQRILIKNYKTN